MRLWNLLAGSVVAVCLVAGCESTKDKAASSDAVKKTETPKADAPKVDAPKVDDKAAKEAAVVAKAEYHEVEHDGRLYVMASKETAASGAKGKHPALSVTKIGFGPRGETVVFEDSEGGGVAKKLTAAFKSKYKID